MKKIILLFVFVAAIVAANAQNLIAVEHNGISKFYTTLDSAVNAAQTGDNVFVPGGNFTLSRSINKGFNLIGVGYNPDSTLATGFTQITAPSGNTIYIVTGADNGSTTGIYFYNTIIQFGTSAANQTVNGYTISRCRISYDVNLGYSSPLNSVNIILNENVIDGSINGRAIKNCVLSKNIIGVQVTNFSQGNQFINNIFLYAGPAFDYDTSSIFKNNIVLTTDNYGYDVHSANNISYNNLFAGNKSYLIGTDIGSLYNITQSSIFVNQTGNTYDYKQNYHLKPTCPGKNYGTDGTDIGLYGTATPWKDGGVPFNPHIQFQSIATQTDGNGNLSVNIKVAAQKN